MSSWLNGSKGTGRFTLIDLAQEIRIAMELDGAKKPPRAAFRGVTDAPAVPHRR